MMNKKLSMILKFIFLTFLFILFTSLNSKAASGPLTKKGASSINPNDKVVNVSTPDEYIDALIKSKNVYDKRNNDEDVSTDSGDFYANKDTQTSNNNGGDSNIIQINITKDIDLTKSSYGRFYMHRTKNGGPNGSTVDGQSTGLGSGLYEWYNTQVKHNGTLTINGNGHKIDYGYSNTALQIGDQNWTFKDLTIYGQSYYGPLSINDPNCNISYDNVSYYGPQLIHSQSANNCKIDIYGNVDVHSVPWYYSFEGDKYSTQSNSGLQDEQNMQVGDIEFHSNSHYNGETYGGNVLELSGGMSIDEGAEVELHPHNFGPTENGVDNNGNSVAILFGSNSYLNANKDSKLNIICNSKPLNTNNNQQITDPNASSSKPNRVSKAIHSNGSNSSINLYDGADINIDVNGYIKSSGSWADATNSDSAVSLTNLSMNIERNASFNINFNKNNNLNGFSDNGVMYLNNGNFNVDQGGTLNIDSNLKNTQNKTNYLMAIKGNVNINLNNPQSVYLNDQDQVDAIKGGYYNNRTNSNLIYNAWFSSSYINATDVSLNTDGQDSQGKDIGINSSLPFHRLLFPVNSSQKIETSYVRILGDYFNSKALANSINSGNGQQYAMMHFTQMPTPYMTLSNSSADDNTGQISGNVKDQNGKILKNAYVKIYINQNGKKSYYYDTEDSQTADIDSLIKQNQILYNKNKKGFPADGSTNYTSGSSFSKNTLKSSDFNNPIFFDENIFANKLNDTNFNNNSTMYDKADPYIALTDENGNFDFKIPNQAWQDIGDGKATLNVYSTYNFVNSMDYQINLNQNLQVKIDTSMKNLSKNQSDGTTTLDDVDQGNAEKNGDTLEFNSTLENNSQHYDYQNLVYEQPVPSSLDTSTLYIKKGDGDYEKLNSSDYEVVNQSNYKIIKVKDIGELKKKYNMSISLKGTLKNSDTNDTSKYDPMTFNTQVSNPNNSIKGPDMTINFTKPHNLEIDPQDLYYSDNNPNKNGLTLSSIYNNKLGVIVNDKRMEKTPVSLFVHQNNDTFSNDGNGSGSTFKGELFYYNGSNLNSLLNHDVKVATSDANNQLNNVYWKQNNQILLKLENNFDFEGDYQNGNRNTDNPGLSWTVTNGPS